MSNSACCVFLAGLFNIYHDSRVLLSGYSEARHVDRESEPRKPEAEGPVHPTQHRVQEDLWIPGGAHQW